MASSKSTVEERLTTIETDLVEIKALLVRKKTEPGICALGVDPSEKCEHGSLSRYQSGCRGESCMEAQRVYFREYRAEKKAAKPSPITPPVVAKAKAAPKATKKAAPVKVAAKKSLIRKSK
jgi:hypothetical protein